VREVRRLNELALLGSIAEKGCGFGLLVAAFWLGFRHGIDWDHIAAITDITGSQEERRRAMLFGTLYAMGHAVVVFVLGVLAILLAERLPDSVDEVLGRVVGVTLILLGVYVFVSLIRHGRDFRLRSRWMLVFSGVRRGVRWVRGRARARTHGSLAPQTEPAGTAVLMTNEDSSPEASSWHHGHHGRPGHHHHQRPEEDDTFMNYGKATSFGVGMIHGIGAETPTQVVVFLAAAACTSGRAIGVAVLVAFIVGLLGSNSLITLGSAFGFLKASTNFPVYATVAVITGVFSLAIGMLFILGKESLLPALFGG
jgi:cytochrome c biogenesis protein CcdA